MPRAWVRRSRCGCRHPMGRHAPTSRQACHVTQVVLFPGPVSPSSSTVPAADSPFRERRVRARATDLVGHPLLPLLALASLLRVMLVVQGGQQYWPDERLYTQVLDIFDLHQGHWFDILKALFSTQDHLGFALLSAPIAAVQLA